MKFFVPEDFSNCCFIENAMEKCADKANAKLDRMGKVVYGVLKAGNNEVEWSETKYPKLDKHKALLINIETIEDCPHPWQKVDSFYEKACNPKTKYFKCECGARVEPWFKEVK